MVDQLMIEDTDLQFDRKKTIKIRCLLRIQTKMNIEIDENKTNEILKK